MFIDLNPYNFGKKKKGRNLSKFEKRKERRLNFL